MLLTLTIRTTRCVLINQTLVSTLSSQCKQPLTARIVSTRTNSPAKGTVQIKLGFAQPPNITNLMEYSEVYSQLVKIARPSLVSAPPTEGIGTIRSHEGGPRFEDDGLSSDEGESETEDEEDELLVRISKGNFVGLSINLIPASGTCSYSRIAI